MMANAHFGLAFVGFRYIIKSNFGLRGTEWLILSCLIK